MQPTMNQQERYGIRVCMRSMCEVKVDAVYPAHMPAFRTLCQSVLALLLFRGHNSQHLVMHELGVEPFLLLWPAEIVLPIVQQALQPRSDHRNRSDHGFRPFRRTDMELSSLAADLQECQLGTVVPTSACQLIGVSS